MTTQRQRPAPFVRRRVWRRRGPRRYPIWSVKTISLVVLVVVGLSSLVFLLPRTSVFVELELILGAVAIALFAFLAVGLHHGARIRKREDIRPDLAPVGLDEIQDVVPDVGLPDIDCPADAHEGCLGILLSLLVAVVVLIGLVLALWLLINAAIGVFFVLLLALSWVFARALRVVFARSRGCQGKWRPSLLWAALYTTLYTGWLFALLELAYLMAAP